MNDSETSDRSHARYALPLSLGGAGAATRPRPNLRPLRGGIQPDGSARRYRHRSLPGRRADGALHAAGSTIRPAQRQGPQIQTSIGRTPFPFMLGSSAVISGWNRGDPGHADRRSAPVRASAGAGLRRSGQSPDPSGRMRRWSSKSSCSTFSSRICRLSAEEPACQGRRQKGNWLDLTSHTADTSTGASAIERLHRGLVPARVRAERLHPLAPIPRGGRWPGRSGRRSARPPDPRRTDTPRAGRASAATRAWSVDVAQREHAQRLEQRARRVRQGKDQRGLVGGAERLRVARDQQEPRDVVAVVLDRRSAARSGRRSPRRAPRRSPRCRSASDRESAGRCRRCRRWRRSRRWAACAGTARTAPAPADASRRGGSATARCPAARSDCGRPAARSRRRSADRARAAGRSCGGCCRRSSSRSAAGHATSVPAATEAKTSSKCSHGTVSTPGQARCAAISL